MKKLAIIILTLIGQQTFSQDLTLSQTVDYINKKLLDNPSIVNSNFYHNHKYVTQIEVTSDGYLVIYHYDYNRQSDEVDYKDCFVSKEKLLISKSRLAGRYNKFSNSLNNPDDCVWADGGIAIYGNIKSVRYPCDKPNLEYSSTSPNTGIGCANGEEFGESMCNALIHLFKLVNNNPEMAPKKDANDPFASKAPISKPGQISTGNNTNVINMKKDGGVYTIPVVLNGVLKISFIYDSGASDVSISPDVALTLIKTGTLTQADFVGSQKYYFADGSSATSKVFFIREIQIGNQTITNIKASISNNIDAPMLLGQSVMQQFGKITVDNALGTLTISK